MIRSFLILLVLAPLVFGAPLPKEQKAELYYPVQVGAKRVMDTDNGRLVLTEIVEKVDIKDGKYLVTISRTLANDHQSLTQSSVMEVSTSGHYAIVKSEKGIESRTFGLKLPLKEGDSWEMNHLTYTAGKVEEVEVPAGKFKAIRISHAKTASSLGSTSWLAPKVGWVKTIDYSEDGSEHSVSVLKSFTPGKEAK